MSANSGRGAKRVVAVFGAGGHTGRFVVAELLRRGIVPIAIARDPGSLAAAKFLEHEVPRRRASVDNANSLDQALDGAEAIINCAGPFLETAHAVLKAALRAGIHYLDVSAEQPSARSILDQYDIAAREAGVVVIPAMGFYGGFADFAGLCCTEGRGGRLAACGDDRHHDRSRQLASDARHAHYGREKYRAALRGRGGTTCPCIFASFGKGLGVRWHPWPPGRG